MKVCVCGEGMGEATAKWGWGWGWGGGNVRGLKDVAHAVNSKTIMPYVIAFTRCVSSVGPCVR